MLRTFQERFSDAVGKAEQCLDSNHAEDGGGKTVKMKNALMISLRNKLEGLRQLLSQAESSMDLVTFAAEIDTCTQLLARLEGWLEAYTRRTDNELTELRSRLIEIQIASASTGPAFTTSCSERESGYPVSVVCSLDLHLIGHVLLLHLQPYSSKFIALWSCCSKLKLHFPTNFYQIIKIGCDEHSRFVNLLFVVCLVSLECYTAFRHIRQKLLKGVLRNILFSPRYHLLSVYYLIDSSEISGCA